jgi:hypothetical protein
MLLFLFRLFLSIGIFFVVTMIIFTLVDKMFGVKESIDISNAKGKQMAKTGTKIIYIASAILLPVLLLIGIPFKWFMVFFFALLWGFHGVLDWIYARETRQYIPPIFTILYVAVIILNFNHILYFIFEGW